MVIRIDDAEMNKRFDELFECLTEQMYEIVGSKYKYSSDEERIDIARAKALVELQKRFDSYHEEKKSELQDSFAIYGKSRKGEEFPRKWMLSPKLKPVMERYHISEILNYIDRAERSFREQSKPEELNDLTRGEYHKTDKDEYQYCIFITDEKFYAGLSKKLGMTPRWAREIIAELVKVGALKRLRRAGNRQIYADGYLQPVPGFGGKRKNFLMTRKLSRELQKLSIRGRRTEAETEACA